MNANITKIKDFIIEFGPIAHIYTNIFGITFIFAIYKKLSKTEFFELLSTCSVISFILFIIIIIIFFIFFIVL